MKNLFVCLSLLVFVYFNSYSGDTIVISTINWSTPVNSGWLAPREGKYVFPPDSIRFEKILMYYKLKCDPTQSPACGEWDYLSYTHLWEHTGLYDSTLMAHSNLTVNSAMPDSVQLVNTQTYSYNPYFQYQMVYTDTTSLQSWSVGSGSTTIDIPLGAGNPDSRTQFLWSKSVLQTAGMSAGNITGLKLNFSGLGGIIGKLTIKIKTITTDSLNSNAPHIESFSTVYSSNTIFFNTGWNSIPFTTNFNWDGNTNLLVDISFSANTSAYTLVGENTSFASCLHSSEQEYCLSFNGSDYVEIPASSFAYLDSSVTFSFWQYGDPVMQPSNDCIFEGLDSVGNRVVNVHLPWSDGKIYWDAGNVGDSYDRAVKATTNTSQYKGKWNHWAFTKNAQTGVMRIYLNGVIIMTAGGKTKLMKGIKKFKIGSGGNGTWGHYHGLIDDFSIWKTALDVNSIRNIMYKKIDSSNLNYSFLLANFRFNEGTGMQTAEEIAGHSAQLVGYPEWKSYEGSRIKDFEVFHVRPNIVFEQGVFTSQLDSMLVIDTIPDSPLLVVLYDDTLHPNIPTDTLYAWNPSYTYTFDANGVATDSLLQASDTVIHKIMTNYYDTPFEVLNKYELGRFITPYGNGLSLDEGWTWIYDVSDFRPLLKDTVHLAAGNFQELLDLKFYMIKGIPPRDVVAIENVWQGDFSLNNFVAQVSPKTINLSPDASMFKLRTTVTGHQFDNATNCAEFCPKVHSLNIDGVQRYSWQIIQECSRNPLYPQGGTWIYARAGWCPGMPASTQHLELTPYISGNQVTLDYNSQYDNYGNYVTETQLVSYTSPNFSLDAAVEAIISPSNYELNKRINPICGKPEIIIKNTGATTLTSLDISYRFEGGNDMNYTWTGSLAFLSTANVKLPEMDFDSPYASSEKFIVSISNPNGQLDQYALNNTMQSSFQLAPVYTKPLIINFKTNSFPGENYYRIYNTVGDIVYNKSGFTANNVYIDTLDLPYGCYEFALFDNDEDGISWWANSDGSGYLKFKLLDGTDVHTFNPDFGSETRKWFSLAEPSGLQCEIKESGLYRLYPNPTTGHLTVASESEAEQLIQIKIYSTYGMLVYENVYMNFFRTKFHLNLSNLSAGIYFVQIIDQRGSEVKRVVLK